MYNFALSMVSGILWVFWNVSPVNEENYCKLETVKRKNRIGDILCNLKKLIFLVSFNYSGVINIKA
jgi:hypothetical protein